MRSGGATPAVTQSARPAPILSPLLIPATLFERVARYLWKMIGVENAKDSESKLRAQLKTMSISWTDVKSSFMAQLRAYFRGTLPRSYYNAEVPLLWWRDRLDDPEWYLIAVRHHNQCLFASFFDLIQFLAVKLFSIVPNSMADERTVSVFTWLNSRLRNAQGVGTLVEQTQIRQWHRHSKQVST